MEDNFPILISCKPLRSGFENLNRIEVNSREFKIGRGLGNSVAIPSIYISRTHCILEIQGDDWFIKDLSACGIQINGKVLGKGVKKKILHNDVIMLEPTKEFVYLFCLDDDCVPRKRIKIEPDEDNSDLNDVRIKFEESQNNEVMHLEEKIQKQKLIQETNQLLKHQLHKSMNRKLQQLQNDYASQIDSLKGGALEVEKQKSLLLAERNEQISAIKKETDQRIKELMEQIQKHSEIECKLIEENNSLKEKLLKERENFLAEISRESSSKQDLLERLQVKMKEQEELRLKEKMELEKTLQNELQQLKLAKDREQNELAEQQKRREQLLMREHNEIKKNLEMQIEVTEKQRKAAEENLNNQMERLKKLSDEEKVKVDQLVQEREEIQRCLIAAKEDAEKKVKELQMRVEEREVELAALAAERIQKQSEQSGEVIHSLQEQLEKVRRQLRNVECEREKFMTNAAENNMKAGTSKSNTLEEVGEIMESELQCSICAELFVSATTLNCAHTFCHYCITTWKQKKKDCPICRATIVSECRSIVLDSFIDKMVQNLTEEMKKKREDMLRHREEIKLEAERRSSAASDRRNSSESEWNSSEAPNEGQETDYYYYSEDEAPDSDIEFEYDTRAQSSTTSEAPRPIPVVDLTAIPVNTMIPINQTPTLMAAQGTIEVLDGDSSRVSQAHTMEVTAAATVVELEGTGPPDVPVYDLTQ